MHGMDCRRVKARLGRRVHRCAKAEGGYTIECKALVRFKEVDRAAFLSMVLDIGTHFVSLPVRKNLGKKQVSVLKSGITHTFLDEVLQVKNRLT